MAKVYSSGQFLTGNLQHFTLTHVGLAATDMQHIVDTVQLRATVVVIGAIATNDIRIAVENNGAWTAATLDAALEPTDSSTDWTVADFDY